MASQRVVLGRDTLLHREFGGGVPGAEHIGAYSQRRGSGGVDLRPGSSQPILDGRKPMNR